MWWLLIASALAGDALSGLPAQLAQLNTWDERLAAVQALADAGEVDGVRLGTALEVVKMLAELEPQADRARVRTLVAAAVSTEEVPRAEARKAAKLGAELPRIPADDAWIARVPVPVDANAVPPLALAEPDMTATGFAGDPAALGGTLVSAAEAVGWPMSASGDVTVQGTVSQLYGAGWADEIGYGADVSWTVTRGDDTIYAVVTRGFDPGPLDHRSADTILGAAWFNLLAQDAFVAVLSGVEAKPRDDASFEELDAGSMCLYRKKHPDVRPLPVDVGGQVLTVMGSTWGCLDLPVGMRIRSEGTPGAGWKIEAGQRLVLQVAHAANPGWSLLTLEDGGSFDKLTGKGKLDQMVLAPAP